MNSPSFTGTISLPSTSSIGNVLKAKLNEILSEMGKETIQ